MESFLKSNNKKAKIALVSGGMDSAYHAVFARDFTRDCNEYGYNVIWYQSLCNYSNDTPYEHGDKNIYNLINFDEVDLLVLLTITIKDNASLEMLTKKAAEHNVPVISVDAVIENAYSLLLDYEGGLEKIINHIIEEHNVREINFIGAEKGNPISEARENIYRRVLTEHGIEVEENRIGHGWFWHEAAEEVVQNWYDEHHSLPQAFVCANDSMAIGVCNRATQLGYKVPDDLIVTGIDGIDEALNYSPVITTCKRDIIGAAKRSAQLANGILKKKINAEGLEIVENETLFAQSCGCGVDLKNSQQMNNDIKHFLYKELDRANTASENIPNTAEEIIGEPDFVSTLKKLELFMRKVWTKSSWICVCDNFVTTVKELEDVYSSYEDYQCIGYSKNISATLHCVNSAEGITSEILPPFETKELLPDLDSILEIYNNLMVFPLHFRDRAIGYLAFEYENTTGNYYIMNTLACNISMVLENARIQSELHSFANKLEEMYIRDSMTNLMNRRGFYQCISKIYERCINEKLHFMVISIDLDNLKSINDMYGHAEGDNAIIKTAESLTAAADDEIIARFGGDEYVVAGICKSDSYGEEFVKKVNDFLADYNSISNKPYKIQASCGVYKMIPHKDLSIDEFISNADEMMYNQKILLKRHRCAARTRMK